MTAPTTRADVAVVGAGLIGLCTAWRLAQRGLVVVVVDPEPAAAASRAAAGMLAPVSEVTYGETSLLRLMLESLRRYPAFVAELEAAAGQRVGFRQDGTVVVGTDAGDRDELVELHDFQQRLGLSSTLLTSREVRRLEPLLSPGIRSGLLVDGDHSVDNRLLAGALLTALRRAGGVVRRQRAVAVVSDGDHLAGVELDDGTVLATDRVVVAAGPWSSSLAGLPVDAMPAVRPVKGQILRLRAPAGCPLPTRSVRGVVNGREVYLVPRAAGELVVGATVEERGFDTTVTAGAVHDLLHDARSLLPAVDELELAETTAALRPGSADNAPVVGPTSVAGLVVATGHHRNGVLLTPLTADLVAGLVTGHPSAAGEDDELLAATSPLRFGRLEVTV